MKQYRDIVNITVVDNATAMKEIGVSKPEWEAVGNHKLSINNTAELDS